MDALTVEFEAVEDAIDGNEQALTAWESFLEAVVSLVEDLAAHVAVKSTGGMQC